MLFVGKKIHTLQKGLKAGRPGGWEAYWVCWVCWVHWVFWVISGRI